MYLGQSRLLLCLEPLVACGGFVHGWHARLRACVVHGYLSRRRRRLTYCQSRQTAGCQVHAGVLWYKA